MRLRMRRCVLRARARSPDSSQRFRSKAEIARYFSLAAAPAPRSSKTAETKAAEKAAGKEAQQAEKQLERAQADVEKQAALA